jgi:polyferredoxin
MRFDKNKCTDCGVCEEKAPCSSVNSIVKEKTIRGDCHLCGECIKACNFDALYYGSPRKQNNLLIEK